MSGNPLTHVHWSDEELLHGLYGLRETETACPACGARLEALRQRASRLRTSPRVSEDFLRAQRLSIFARVEKSSRAGFAWRVPAAATALLFTAFLFVQQPEPAYEEQEIAAVSDAQFFAEIAEVVNEDQPRAIGAIQSLFEGTD